MYKKTGAFFLLCLLVPVSSYLMASGSRPIDLSGRAAALGGAFVTRTENASSVFYNPAGLAFSTGLRAEANTYFSDMALTAEHPEFPRTFQSARDVFRASPFVSLNIRDRISLGFGAFTPNSMDIQWPEHWTGHALSVRSKWNSLYVRPAFAIKISKNLALGVGMDFITSNIGWKYDRIFTFQESGSAEVLTANSESDVSAKGKGLVAGVLIRIGDRLSIGGRYNAKVRLDFEGSHSFLFPRSNDTPFSILQSTTTTLTIPREFVVGIMFSPMKDLSVQMDFQRIGMSELNGWDFRLDPLFYEAITEYYGTRPDSISPGVGFSLEDTSRLMFGVEYRPHELIAVRAGFSTQKSSQKDHMINPVYPDLQTSLVTVGIGYDGSAYSTLDNEERIGGFSFDLFYQYGFSPDSTSALPELSATYRASRWTMGLSVGFSFGTE